MKRSEPVELMNMCVLRRGSKVLVQDRTDPTGQALLFRAVMLKRVNPLQMPSFVRFSETGLTISSPRLCGITDWCKDGVRHVVLLYRAEQFTGTLRSSDEGEVWWAELAGLPRSILHLPTCSTFSACLKKMISASCSTARTVKIGLTN